MVYQIYLQSVFTHLVSTHANLLEQKEVFMLGFNCHRNGFGHHMAGIWLRVSVFGQQHGYRDVM